MLHIYVWRLFCRFQLINAEIRRQELKAAIQQKLLTEGTDQDPDFKEVWPTVDCYMWNCLFVRIHLTVH